MARSLRTAFAAFTVAFGMAPAAYALGEGNAEWQKLVAAAEQEGSLIINLPPSNTQREFLQAEWPKAFPKIRLEMTSVDASQWMQRVRIERILAPSQEVCKGKTRATLRSCGDSPQHRWLAIDFPLHIHTSPFASDLRR